MTPRLSNPAYSYVKGGAATVSCTLDVLADTGEVLASTGMSYTDQLKTVAGLVYGQFGTTDFNVAVGQIMTDAAARIEV